MGEVALARTVFGSAIDYSKVRIRRRKWFPFQPRKITMAPRGHIHFHPGGEAYSDDFAAEPLLRQGLFIHEMTTSKIVQLGSNLGVNSVSETDTAKDALDRQLSPRTDIRGLPLSTHFATFR